MIIKIFKNSNFKNGGNIPIYPETDKSLASVEVEDQETVKTPDGKLSKFEGDTHAEGGIPTYLPEGSIIFSEYLKVPDNIKELVLGAPTKKKYSYADLSKKFPTEPLEKKLKNPDMDEFQKKGAEIMLANRGAMLDTIFTAQELDKMQRDKKSGKKFQAGGQVHSDPLFNFSDLSDGFTTDALGRTYDPKTGVVVKRDPKTGLYNMTGERVKRLVDEPAPIGSTDFTPTTSNKFPAMTTETPYFQGNYDWSTNGLPPEQTGQIEPKDNTYPSNANSFDDHNNIIEILDRKNGVIPSPKRKGNIGPSKVAIDKGGKPKPIANFDMLPSSSPSQVLGTDTNDRTDVASLIMGTNPVDANNANQGKSKIDFSKFGISPKLAGTILDVGLALSDKLNIKNPTLYNNQKTPLFNRFVEFDNKEVNRSLSLAVKQIQDSNMPEQVKQSRIAELTANAVDSQAKVDFTNQQRYENKQDNDLNKLQNYIDTNQTVRNQDLDSYNQRKAKVDYLKDQFKAQQKSRVVNSVRSELDYIDTTNMQNQIYGENYKINPITGKVQFTKGKQDPLKVQEDKLKEYQKSGQGSIPIGNNGATLTMLSPGVGIVTGADGKVEVVKLQ